MMYRNGLVCIALLVSGLSSRADEASDVVELALKAHFSKPEDIKKYRTLTIQAQGTSRNGPDLAPASLEVKATWPRKMRINWEFGGPGGKKAVTICGQDDRGWIHQAGSVSDLSSEQINDFWADAYATWVGTLTTLKDPENKFASAPPIRTATESLLGVKVTRRLWPEVTLYFDSKTYLLRRMSYSSRDSGRLLAKEMRYSDHKDFHGAKMPTKQVTMIQGAEFFNWKELSYSFPERLEGKVFEKP